MVNFPEIIHFRLTSRCNNNCTYCYSPPKNLAEMNLLKIKKLFKLFHDKGVKAVLLTGGEPLLYENFEAVINELKKYNFKIYLDTCGDLFYKYKDLIAENVEVLGLPIDFHDKSYRNKDNLNKVLEILTFFKNRKTRPRIRIGTVVTQDNVNSLEKVGNLLTSYPVDVWKIYEFIPQQCSSLKNKDQLEVTTSQFDNATQSVKEKFSNYFNVVISKRVNRTRNWIFVNSNGMCSIAIDNLDISIDTPLGNIFDEKTLEKWDKIISKTNYTEAAEHTFNYKL